MFYVLFILHILVLVWVTIHPYLLCVVEWTPNKSIIIINSISISISISIIGERKEGKSL